MSAAKILLIEDDLKIAKLLEEYLRGFQFQVHHVEAGLQGLEAIKRQSYDVLLLDIMLPDIDGFEVLKRLRQTSQIPVIMLTARGETPDRVVGLEMGADDYLPKPFEPRELVARIHSLLRRTSQSQGPQITKLIAEDLQLNMQSFSASLAGEDLQLTTHEFELLKMLMQNSQRVLTREMIMDQLTGIEAAAFDRSIDIAISRLRQKLKDNPKAPQWIKTIWGQGYLFLKEVKS